MKVMVALEMYRALEKKYSEAVGATEWVMCNPMRACEICAKNESCKKNSTDCVPVWKGRREV